MWTCHALFGVVRTASMPLIDDALPPNRWADHPARDELNKCTWLGIGDWLEQAHARRVALEMPWDTLPEIAGWHGFRKFGAGPFSRNFVEAIADHQPTAMEIFSKDGYTLFEQTNTWDDQRIFGSGVDADVVRSLLRDRFHQYGVELYWPRQ